MVIRGLACGILVLVLSLTASWRYPHLLPQVLRDHLRLVVPEPRLVEDALRRERAPRLTKEELQALKDDGVVFVKGLVKGKDLIAKLRRHMWLHTEMPFYQSDINHKTWLYNGAVRALLRDGPLGDLLGQAYGKENGLIYVNEAPIWGYDQRATVTSNGWHTDARQPGANLYSIWMVLTDGPTALEFLRGSSVARDEIEEACARPKPGGKKGFKTHDDQCVDGYAPVLERNLSMKGRALFGPDLEAGDAFLFSGDVLHRGLRQLYPRIAISLRARWIDRRDKGGCNWKLPQVYPPGTDVTIDFDCAPWVVLPGFPSYSPRLSAGSFTTSILRFFERL